MPLSLSCSSPGGNSISHTRKRTNMAENNSLLDKLDGLVSRFEEVSTLITDPSVIADQKRYVKLTKEYIGCLQNVADAKEMLAIEDDAETK